MFNETQVNLIVTDGGLGDLIGALVPVDWLVRHTDKTFHVWVPDYLVEFAKHVLPTKRCLVRSFKDGHLCNKKLRGRTTAWVENGPTPMRVHAVDYGFAVLADRTPLSWERSYLQIRPQEVNLKCFDLPKDYCCIQAAFAEPCKTMSPDIANKIIEFVKQKGLTPCFIGREEAKTGFKDLAVKAKTIPIDLTQGVNLVNRCSLLETAAVIAGARCFIGMEGGLVHLAGCTGTKIVAGFVLGDPFIHAAPVRNAWMKALLYPIEPFPDTPGRYYQTYASCFDPKDCRQHKNWQRVLQDMTAERFIEQIVKTL